MADTAVIESVERAKEIINGIRSVRARKNIRPARYFVLNVIGTVDVCTRDMIVKLGGLEELNENAAKDAAASSFMVGTTEFNIPQSANIDIEAERARITKDIAYLQGFKASVEKKLANERFVSHAPEAVVAAERKKLADAEAKLATLEASLAALS